MKVSAMNWLAATWAAKGTVPKKPTSNAQISQNHHSLPESFGGWWISELPKDWEQRSGGSDDDDDDGGGDDDDDAGDDDDDADDDDDETWWNMMKHDEPLLGNCMETHEHIHGKSSYFIIRGLSENHNFTLNPMVNPHIFPSFSLRNDDTLGGAYPISTSDQTPICSTQGMATFK